MEKFGIKKSDYMYIVVGTMIVALGINWFLVPVSMVTGGLSGLAIIIDSFSSNILGMRIPVWATTFVFNIPLFIILIAQKGIRQARKSIVGVVCITFFLWVTQFVPNPFLGYEDLLLSSVFAAAFLGTGVGFILRANATTGGTDTLAMIIKHKHKNFPISKLILTIDSTIILFGFFVFGPQKAMYAIICVVLTSRFISQILEGMHYAKAAFIVSDKIDAIADEIMVKIPRGATGINARGMYTKKEKQMLFVVVSKKEIVLLRELVQTVDKDAFMTIADVKEVVGQGFIEDLNSVAI